jgi:exosortase
LAVPLERILVLQFAQPLQLWASTLAGALAHAAGMPVRQVGTSLVLPEYTFEVDISCSGLKSSLALASLGALLAYGLAGPAWARLLIFLASVPMALIANALRILCLLVVARSVSPSMAEGLTHAVSGYAVFVMALLGLWGLGRGLGCVGIRSDL